MGWQPSLIKNTALKNYSFIIIICKKSVEKLIDYIFFEETGQLFGESER